MSDKFKEILNRIEDKDISVPNNLTEGIVLRINDRERHNSKIKALGLSFVSLASFLLSIPIISQIITSFTQSGIYNYISIIFSDSDVAITYWKEISLSLAESLPILAITSLLAVLAIFTWSTLKARAEVKNSLIIA